MATAQAPSAALAPLATAIGPTPLPHIPWSDTTAEGVVWCEAFKECLSWEKDSTADGRIDSDLVYARILGYLLLHASHGRTHVAREILECEADATKLRKLAKLYQDHLLQACQAVDACAQLTCADPSSSLSASTVNPKASTSSKLPLS